MLNMNPKGFRGRVLDLGFGVKGLVGFLGFTEWKVDFRGLWLLGLLG